MKIIPAIDIQNGNCVRLRQGDFSQETIFNHSPIDMAEKWVKDGAQRLHIVDLDGARLGAPINIELISSRIYICRFAMLMILKISMVRMDLSFNCMMWVQRFLLMPAIVLLNRLTKIVSVYEHAPNQRYSLIHMIRSGVSFDS